MSEIKITDLSTDPEYAHLQDYFFAETAETKYTFNETPVSFYISDQAGETILEITPDGDAIWHKPEAACEAAAVFSANIKDNWEQAAGIRQKRKDWEDQKIAAISGALKKGALTEEKLIEIIRKHEFLGRLSGDIS